MEVSSHIFLIRQGTPQAPAELPWLLKHSERMLETSFCAISQSHFCKTRISLPYAAFSGENLTAESIWIIKTSKVRILYVSCPNKLLILVWNLFLPLQLQHSLLVLENLSRRG